MDNFPVPQTLGYTIESHVEWGTLHECWCIRTAVNLHHRKALGSRGGVPTRPDRSKSDLICTPSLLNNSPRWIIEHGVTIDSADLTPLHSRRVPWKKLGRSGFWLGRSEPTMNGPELSNPRTGDHTNPGTKVTSSSGHLLEKATIQGREKSTEKLPRHWRRKGGPKTQPRKEERPRSNLARTRMPMNSTRLISLSPPRTNQKTLMKGYMHQSVI